MKATSNKLALFLFFLLLACGSKKTELNSEGTPGTLLIAVFGGEGPGDITDRLKSVDAYLEKKLGIPVEIKLTSDYTAVIEALRAKKVHVAYLEPFSYVLATEKGAMNANIDVLVTLGKQGTPYLYRSLIITNPTTGLKTMDDLKANAKNLTFCFTDPASNSGHLVPRAYLNSIDLNPTTSFKNTVFASSHTASIMTVKAGKVDVGCTYDLWLSKMLANGKITEKEILVLWRSEPMVNGPIVIRKDINAALRLKIQQAYIDFPNEEREAWKYYLKMISPTIDGDSVNYVAGTDSMYDGTRKVVNDLGDVTKLH